MNPTIYIKNDKYAVQYISETRKDKSLLIVPDEKAPIICNGESTQFLVPEGYRQPIFNNDQHYNAVVKILESLLDDFEYSSPAFSIINEMLVHLDCQKNRNYTFTMATEWDADYIVQRFVDLYNSERQKGDTREDFYCGITYDIDIRMREHENKDNKKYSTCYAFLCKSAEIASDVEILMKNNKFNIGGTNTFGNGAKVFSRFVYMYRM